MAKSGVLCAKCKSKLESRSITWDDVEAAIKLARLANRNQNVDKFTLVHGAKGDDDCVLVLRSPDVAAIQGDSGITKKIEGELGQKVWSVGAEASGGRFVEGILYSLKVLSVNLFWLPGGSRLTRATVAGGDRARVNIEKVQKIAKTITNIKLLVEFENR